MSIVPSQKKIPAGILAILLGGLGVHKFFLGMNREGLVMLALTLLSLPLACVGLGFIPFVVQVIGIIEGVIYLTKSDQDFYLDYIVSKKGWF